MNEKNTNFFWIFLNITIKLLIFNIFLLCYFYLLEYLINEVELEILNINETANLLEKKNEEFSEFIFEKDIYLKYKINYGLTNYKININAQKTAIAFDKKSRIKRVRRKTKRIVSCKYQNKLSKNLIILQYLFYFRCFWTHLKSYSPVFWVYLQSYMW